MADTIFGFHSGTLVLVAAGVALLAGFPRMSGSFRTASILFLGLGIVLLLWSGQPASVWGTSMGSATSLISIVTVMQLFSVPIRVGRYDLAISTWMRGRFRTRSSFFAMTTMTSHVLTSFLNMGSVPVMVNLFRPVLMNRFRDWQRFFSRAFTRGYVLAALWSPGAINIYLIAGETGLTWSDLFLPGMVLAASGMMLSTLLEAIESRRFDPGRVISDTAGNDDVTGVPDTVQSGVPVEIAGTRVRQVVLVALIFIVLVALFDRTGRGTATGRSIVVGGLIALGWTVLLHRQPGIGNAFREYWIDGTAKVADVAPFFVSMGVFTAGLQGSGILDVAGDLMQMVVVQTGWASVVIIAFLMVAVSLVGLHPFITIMLFGQILQHVDIPVARITLALGMTTGSVTSYMVTPFAGVIMTLARYIGVSAVDVAVRWNWRFCTLFFVLGIGLSFGWGYLAG